MFLLDRFQDFYREVLRLRESVSQGAWVFDAERSAAPSAQNTPGGDTAPTAVWRTLLTLLERQALEAGRSGGDFALEIYRRAQYAMAALADEVFLNLDWAGREAWRDHLLEARLFGSHRAGEELFERIEELLRDRDTVYGELARVYLTVLALGFQGRYRGQPDGERELDSYRRRLFRFIFGRDPQTVTPGGGGERLVPQAYASTLDEGARSTLPHLKPWLWAVALLTVLWIAGGHLLWRGTVAGLEPLVDEVLGSPVPAASSTASSSSVSSTMGTMGGPGK